MEQDFFQSIGTVLAFIAFLGICWWVYIAHDKSDFDEAANLPFADEQPASDQQGEEQKSSGSEEKSI